MTFEEFLIKKKIGIDEFRSGRPDLYEEFRTEYAQMGPKSFDHSKKFWFNKLRRTYPLPVSARPSAPAAPKPVASTIVAGMPDFSTQAEELLSPTIEQTQPPSQAAPKPAFQPRFKPGGRMPASTPSPADAPAAKDMEVSMTVPEEKVSPESLTPSPDDSVPADAKPAVTGFKPRFKAGVTKAVPSEEALPEAAPTVPENSEPAAEPPVVTGFKPRFKAGVTKAVPNEGILPEAAPTVPETSEPAGNPPVVTGFKPRFKAGVTKAAENNSAPDSSGEPPSVPDNSGTDR